MAPTRELAYQIYIETKAFSNVLKLNCSCVYGGAGLGGQLSELKKGAEIVVCTPGRMIDVLCLNNGRITNLQRVLYFLI
jgi:ATP-dependent RNA helicase DDX46/PRP5